MSNLYELTGMYLQVQAHLEADDDYPIDLLTVGDELDKKIENYGFIIRNFESEAQALSDEIKRLQERKKTAEKAVDRLKDQLYNTMKETGKLKVKTPHFQFSIASKGGKRPLKFVEGMTVPEQYCKVVMEPDKEKIRSAIEEDGEILDFAYLEERGDYLRMR